MENNPNDSGNPPFHRTQSLETGVSQPRVLSIHHTTSMPSFQRRTTDSARQLRDNLSNVIREIQPLVETALYVNSRSQPLAVPDNNSYVINLGEDNPAEQHQNENNNNAEDGANPERLQTVLEAQQLLQVLIKYVPFVMILLVKALFDFHEAIFTLVALFAIFVHSNSTVKKEATKRQKREIMLLIIELVYIFGCCVWVNLFYPGEFHKMMNLTLIKEFSAPLSLSNLLWIVIVTDFTLKLITVVVKIFLTMLPAQIIAFQKRGKIYLFIEALSQMYRSLATVQPWLIYLLESYQGVEKILSVFLSAFYMISKGGDLLAKIKMIKSAFWKLLQNVTVGTSPSKEQILTVGEHCPICHDEYESPVLLQCRHIFCESCVTTWFDREQSCPLCRAKIVDDPSWRDGSTSYFIQLY